MSPLSKIKNKSVPSLINDFFNNGFFGSGFLDLDGGSIGGLKVPLANVTESKNEFSIELLAPGLKREDFKVEVEDGTLTISSEKEEKKEDVNKEFKRKEFSFNSFSRTFELPENVSEDKINAKYDNGVLRITIPKKEISASKPKKAIEVA